MENKEEIVEKIEEIIEMSMERVPINTRPKPTHGTKIEGGLSNFLKIKKNEVMEQVDIQLEPGDIIVKRHHAIQGSAGIKKAFCPLVLSLILREIQSTRSINPDDYGKLVNTVDLELYGFDCETTDEGNLKGKMIDGKFVPLLIETDEEGEAIEMFRGEQFNVVSSARTGKDFTRVRGPQIQFLPGIGVPRLVAKEGETFEFDPVDWDTQIQRNGTRLENYFHLILQSWNNDDATFLTDEQKKSLKTIIEHVPDTPSAAKWRERNQAGGGTAVQTPSPFEAAANIPEQGAEDLLANRD